MADTFHFELVSPERLLTSGDVAMVVVPGSEGDFGVLQSHAPVISTMRPGILEIYEQEGASPTRVYIRGGFADVALDRLTVLAEEAIPLADLDKEALEQRISDTREDIEDAKTDEERTRHERVLEQLTELANAL